MPELRRAGRPPHPDAPLALRLLQVRVRGCLGRSLPDLNATVILNPAAGRGSAGRARERLAQAFRRAGWVVEILMTERPGHATQLARAAARNGAERIIAVGGDGAVHEVANGILAAGSSAALGVVPIGTGNDFAKLVGVYRHSVDRAVARLVAAVPHRFDTGKVLGEYFVNTLGFGFGPAVVQRRNAMPGLKGFLSYLVPVVRTFATFRPPLFEVQTDSYRERGNMMMVEVCNGTTAGGSYRFAPDADPQDGMLDICLIRKIGLARFLVALPRVMRGTHGRMKEVTLTRSRSVTICSPEAALLLHLDGELRTPDVHECTVTVEPRCLNVLVAG